MFVLYYWGRVFKRIGLDIKDHYGWGVLPALFGVFGAGFYAIDQVRTVGLLAMFSEWLSFWHSLLYVGLPTFVVVIVILAVITPARIDADKTKAIEVLEEENRTLKAASADSRIKDLQAQVDRLSYDPPDREIAAKQVASFKAAVDKLPSSDQAKLRIADICATSDHESQRYALKLLKMFETAGVLVSEGPNAVPAKGEHGVIVVHCDDDESRLRAERYRNLLQASDIATTARLADERYNGPLINIVVAPQARPA